MVATELFWHPSWRVYLESVTHTHHQRLQPVATHDLNISTNEGVPPSRPNPRVTRQLSHSDSAVWSKTTLHQMLQTVYEALKLESHTYQVPPPIWFQVEGEGSRGHKWVLHQRVDALCSLQHTHKQSSYDKTLGRVTPRTTRTLAVTYHLCPPFIWQLEKHDLQVVLVLWRMYNQKMNKLTE